MAKMNLSRTWQGDDFYVSSSESNITPSFVTGSWIHKGSSADSFEDVPGEPDYVRYTFYVACKTIPGVKVRRDGFNAKRPAEQKGKSSQEYLRDTAGRFASALTRLAQR